MFRISVPYCDCLITVGSNPISAPNFDPLRSRANDFIIDIKHLKQLLRILWLSGLLDPVQDYHSQSTSLLYSLIIQYYHNFHLKILFFYILYHYDMKLCYSDNLDLHCIHFI